MYCPFVVGSLNRQCVPAQTAPAFCATAGTSEGGNSGVVDDAKACT